MKFKILFISNKNWGYQTFKYFKSLKKYTCHFAESDEKLREKLKKFKYEYVFVLHWSSKIPQSLLKLSKFIGLHSSNLPKYAGGSPIQNQIIREIKVTKLSAFILKDKIDIGDVIKQKRLSLNGRLNEILERCTKLSIDIIKDILKGNYKIKKIKPIKYEFYKRLNYQDNNLANYSNLNQIYNGIRMVDSDGYKKSYIVLKNKIKIEFFEAKKKSDHIYCSVKILKI